MRILLVEDEEKVARFIRLGLKAERLPSIRPVTGGRVCSWRRSILTIF